MGKVVEDVNKRGMVLLKGIFVAFVLTLILALIFSIVLTYTNTPESAIFPVLVGITALSILIGSSISTIKIKKNGILNGGIIGLVYILLLYIISSIVSGSFILNINSIILIISAILGGMLRRCRRSKYKIKKVRNFLTFLNCYNRSRII